MIHHLSCGWSGMSLDDGCCPKCGDPFQPWDATFLTGGPIDEQERAMTPEFHHRCGWSGNTLDGGYCPQCGDQFSHYPAEQDRHPKPSSPKTVEVQWRLKGPGPRSNHGWRKWDLYKNERAAKSAVGALAKGMYRNFEFRIKPEKN